MLRFPGKVATDQLNSQVVEASACYLCGQTTLRSVRTKVRYDIPRIVVQCQNCGLNYLMPASADLTEFYQRDYRKIYSGVPGKQLTPRENFELYLPFQAIRQARLVRYLRPEMRVLDVGCSTGHFLYALKDLVGERIGIELNHDHAEFASRELGLEIMTTPIRETALPLKSFDLITVIHVLEHTPDPIRFMSELRPYLKDRGLVYVEVPNLNDALLSLFKSEAYADFWFREAHLFNFSPQTLRLVLAKAGFQGEITGFQMHSFINNINWLLTGTPQESFALASRPARFVPEADPSTQSAVELNAWVARLDDEYAEILGRNLLTDCIAFLGEPDLKSS